MYLSPVLFFFEKYVFNDWDIFISVFLIFFVDTITDTIATLVEQRRIRLTKELIKFVSKFFAIVLTFLCIGIVDNALIGGNTNVLSGIIDATAFAVLLGFEVASTLKNIYRIYPWEPIKHLLAKLEVYYNKREDTVVK